MRPWVFSAIQALIALADSAGWPEKSAGFDMGPKPVLRRFAVRLLDAEVLLNPDGIDHVELGRRGRSQAYGLTIRGAAAHGVPLDLDDVSGLVDGLGVFGLGSHDLVVDFEDEVPFERARPRRRHFRGSLRSPTSP